MYTTAIFLKHIPSFLVPAIYNFIPAYRKLWKIRARAIELIKPVVQARREAMEKPDFDRRDDNMLQWMLNERVKKQLHDKDYEMLALLQLELAMAAIHTSSLALGNMLYDLVAWPKYIEILRQEVKEQLAQNNGSLRGLFVKRLPKLDSFMKESLRRTPSIISMSP